MFNRWISIQKAFISLLICKKTHPDLWISSIDILAALTQTSYPTAFCLLGKADIPEVENSFLGQCVKGTSAALSSQISRTVHESLGVSLASLKDAVLCSTRVYITVLQCSLQAELSVTHPPTYSRSAVNSVVPHNCGLRIPLTRG